MKSLVYVLLTTITITHGTNVNASNLEKCLINNPNQMQTCADKNIKNLTLSSCYSEVTQIKSEHIKEKFKEFCFYQVSEFPTLKLCLEKANLFLISDDGDSAKLSCVTQFQDGLKKHECLNVVKSLKLTEKKWYLQNHCDSL